VTQPWFRSNFPCSCSGILCGLQFAGKRHDKIYSMDETTTRDKLIRCSYCRTEQIVHLLAVPSKPSVVIRKQTVRCVNVKCQREFSLPDEVRIVGGPFAV
jgi:hypothetical protein